jgi:hypothetical protein
VPAVTGVDGAGCFERSEPDACCGFGQGGFHGGVVELVCADELPEREGCGVQGVVFGAFDRSTDRTRACL